jgi:SAM-dependent methyltransferase
LTGRSEHWDRVYGTRDDTSLTWFEEDPAVSLKLARQYLRPGKAFIDVGGGASRLTDKLAALDFGPLAVLDVSPQVLDRVRARLGPRARNVSFIAADVTAWKPDRRRNVWHDRAVFHFLTDPEDRAGYVRAMTEGLEPGGIAIIGTFAEDGPVKCSGLPVVRYSSKDLERTLEKLAPGRFEVIEALRVSHVTPTGDRQSFQFSVFRKSG